MSDWLDAEKFVEQAHELFERGRFDAAESKLREALSLNPFEPEWHYNLALTLEAAGRFTEALLAVEESIRLSPSDSVAHMLAGMTAMRLDNPGRAVESLERAVELEPDALEARLHLIDALARAGRREDAETQFYICQQLDDTDARPFAALADLLLDAGETDRALSCLREAASRDPDLPKLHAQLGRAYARTGRLERSRQLFLLELRRDPGDTGTLMDLADVLIRLHREDEACEKLRRVLETEPDHADAHLELGCLEIERGRLETGLGYLELALRLDADRPGVRRALAGALIDRGQAGDVERATRLLLNDSKVLLKAPDVPDLEELNDLGLMLLEVGQPERSYEVFSAARERVSDPDRDLAHRLSLAAFQAGRLSLGAEWAMAALRIDPTFASPMHNLAVAAFREHRDRRCRYWIERALSIDPDDRAMKRLRLRLIVRAIARWIESVGLSFRDRRPSAR